MNDVARLTQSPLTLMTQAAGSPAEMAQKLARLAKALRQYAHPVVIDERLARLKRLGYVDELPSRVQLAIGAYDMLRFFIAPAAADYYDSKGINFNFHQLLRFLDDPSSMVDPTGLLSTTDNIIGHLMQVTHANPCYDLQLLDAHEGGLEELEKQVEQMLAGTHPRTRSISAIIEDPAYHGKLLEYVRAFRVARDAQAPIRENVADSDRFKAIARTFGTVPNAMRYFCRLPSDPLAAARHALLTRSFPDQFAEPEPLV
ncbi:MAG: hypothetical protein IPI43_03705 [Sandaracinaceae bacterium]|jgi:hypothetical protein|nr:hypothetical protein [Sandaracinaceae bacterium]MBK7773229.1 hypothetical protein [Sandaracinaceae bacterium]